MMSRPTMLGALMLAFALAVPLPAPAHGDAPDADDTDFRDVRRATAHYGNVAAAEAAGYAQFLGCIDEPPRGAMGVHYLNAALVGDAVVDVLKPEALIYEPQENGRLKLVGVEYIVFQEAWDAANPQPPTLFGHPFHLVRSPNRYGVPSFYELHLGVWRHNPDGIFNDWNPRVQCP